VAGGSRLLAIGLGSAALVTAVAWRAQAPQVQHATVPLGQLVVELWRNPVDGEVAFQFQGSHDWTILRRRTLYDLIEGRLSNVTVYLTAADAWKKIQHWYGLMPEHVDAALSGGDSVARPQLMEVPKLDRATRGYLYARDFGTDTGRLRKAAHFPVPAPGPTLAGLQLADVSLLQSRGPGRLVDIGYVAYLVYSADPDRIGTGERLLGLDAASPRSGWGGSYRDFFVRSRTRLVGSGYDARQTSDGRVILRYHGSYVLVAPNWDLPLSQLRAVLSKIGRSRIPSACSSFQVSTSRGGMVEKVNLAEKLALVDERWSPKIVAELNDAHVKVVKLDGEFVWHHHDDEDELFLVVSGRLRMQLRDGDVVLEPGELIVVPKGVEHCPFAEGETHVVLIEPKTTLNTGNVRSERTVEQLERL